MRHTAASNATMTKEYAMERWEKDGGVEWCFHGGERQNSGTVMVMGVRDSRRVRWLPVTFQIQTGSRERGALLYNPFSFLFSPKLQLIEWCHQPSG